MFEFEPLSERIQALRDKRDWFNNGHLRLNCERTKIYTDYYKSHEAEYPILKRAGALYEWCARCSTPIDDLDILVGALGPETRTINFYVEWTINWLDACVNDTDENFKKAWQAPGAVYISDGEREWMKEASAYWKDHCIPAYMEGIAPDDIYSCADNGTNNFGKKGSFMGICGKPQGHYIGNFDKAVRVSFGTVRREALEKLEAMKGRIFGKDARKHAFYRAVVKVCDAAIILSKRYAAACREKALTAAPERKAELLKMADSLDWIMENPARNYWEGLETMLLYQIMLVSDAQQHGESYGRVDIFVGDLLEGELAEGRITPAESQDMTDAFILKNCDLLCMDIGTVNRQIIQLNESGKSLYNVLGQYMTYTSGIHMTLGGQTKAGRDSTNAATRCFLKSYGRLNVPDPTVAIRIHQNTPYEVWELAIESSKRSGGMPQFQNDDIIIPMLIKRGLSQEDARNYSIVGCVEPAGTGCEWPACGNSGSESIWSLVGCVIFAMHGGVNPMNGTRGLPCKKLYEYESFEEFFESVRAQAHYSLDWQVTLCNLYEQMYSEQFPCISASVMMEGCMESGADATWGGCRYNSTGVTCIGIANVADSLVSIKKLCFDEKRIPLRTMYDALCANWVGYEPIRQTIIDEMPHYGNDKDEVDSLASDAMCIFADYLRTREGPRGKYCGGTFTMIAHLYFGMITDATPDGRKRGDSFADAISPRQGFDKNGPTAYIRSAAKLPHTSLWNGDQLNIRFSPTSVRGDDGTAKLKDLIRTYFDLSGMQVQFNVVGTDQLHKAQEKPDDYKNLVVRIAGFSAYFVELNKNMQDDFITRTEQSM